MSGGKKTRAVKATRGRAAQDAVVIFDVPGDTDDAPGNMVSPLLIISRNGTDEALVSSAKARARRLERTLEAWSLGDRDEVNAGELAKFLHANAFEVALMLDEIWRRSLPQNTGAS